MVEIESIDEDTKTVYYDDGTNITYEDFIDKYRTFFKNRIAGETLNAEDMERFMRRTSSKNLHLLMQGKKMEGYLEGSMDKMLTRGTKIAIGVLVTVFFVAIIGLVIAKSSGLI